MIGAQSPTKLKVLERSTGNKKVEEWSFLPQDWKYHLNGCLHGSIHIHKNYGFFRFNTSVDSNDSADDLLILNLVTRNSFWMRKAMIVREIREKAGRVYLNDLWMTRSVVPVRMWDENDGVYIRLTIELNRASLSSAQIGRF